LVNLSNQKKSKDKLGLGLCSLT